MLRPKYQSRGWSRVSWHKLITYRLPWTIAAWCQFVLVRQFRIHRPMSISDRIWIDWGRSGRSFYYRAMHYSAKRGLAIACRLSVRLWRGWIRTTYIGCKSWKLIAQTISPTSSLFVAQRSYTYFQGNMEKFWGENVCSTPTSITSGWIESTESHMILGRGVAGCLFTFIGASRGHFCDSIAFLLYFTSYCIAFYTVAYRVSISAGGE